MIYLAPGFLKKRILFRVFLITSLCGLPLFAQYEYGNSKIYGVHIGMTKTIEMDAQVIGAGKHVGFNYLHKLQQFLALGGGLTFTHVENVVIKSHAPRIALGMIQGKGIARLKTFDNEKNIYGFIDLAPGLAVDVITNDPEDSGVEYKSYWGPSFGVSLGTVMGLGMVKVSIENLLMDDELVTWFSLSLGIGL